MHTTNCSELYVETGHQDFREHDKLKISQNFKYGEWCLMVSVCEFYPPSRNRTSDGTRHTGRLHSPHELAKHQKSLRELIDMRHHATYVSAYPL